VRKKILYSKKEYNLKKSKARNSSSLKCPFHKSIIQPLDKYYTNNNKYKIYLKVPYIIFIKWVNTETITFNKILTFNTVQTVQYFILCTMYCIWYYTKWVLYCTNVLHLILYKCNVFDTVQMYCTWYCTTCTVIKLVYGLCDDEIEGLKSGR